MKSMIIKALISAGVDIVWKAIKYLLSKQFRDGQKEKKQAEERKELREAVRNHETDKVNRKVKKMLKMVPIAAVLTLSAGCITPGETVYIPEEDKVIPMEHDGRKGWWVPDPIMNKLLKQAYENRSESENMETEK